jgi:hypothetical protein
VISDYNKKIENRNEKRAKYANIFAFLESMFKKREVKEEKGD